MGTQRTILALVGAIWAASALTACGGGGSAGSTLTPSAPAQGSPGAPAGSAPPTPAPVKTSAALATAELQGALGFVNAQSHTVYVFDADLAAPGTSTCTDSCASVWPAIAAQTSLAYPAPFTTIKRADGTSQLAYAGRPLYTYIADSAAGSVAGDGLIEFGGTWHIARPQASSPAPATPAPVTTQPPAGSY